MTMKCSLNRDVFMGTILVDMYGSVLEILIIKEVETGMQIKIIMIPMELCIIGRTGMAILLAEWRCLGKKRMVMIVQTQM
ncbi:hypothetical protein SAY86_031202 [Trapa natans]|uniref:Uncharacterized protein n=1 Tax=Trapa natans TaxID=22666 RepID=A0AAN7R3C2_TRANT|nr:hypothetical protein SAY86_031202 [Trapa natans]